MVPVGHLFMFSIATEEIMWVDGILTWMQPIIAYLKDKLLSNNIEEAYKLRRRSVHFVFLDDVLYKRGFSSSILRDVRREEATYIFYEIYEGVCCNHSKGLALARQALRQGYYWPTLKNNAIQFMRKCDKSRHLSPILR